MEKETVGMEKIDKRGLRHFDGKSDEYVLTRVLSDYNDSVRFQTPYFDKFKELYKVYNAITEGVTEENAEQNSARDGEAGPAVRSQLFIPKIFSLVSTLVPKIVLTMFSTKPYVSAVPVDVPDEALRRELSDGFTNYLTYQGEKQFDVIPITTTAVKGAVIYGTAFTKQTWKYETKKKKQRIRNTGLAAFLKGDVSVLDDEVVIADQPKVINVPLLDFFFDPAATSIPSARYVIHRYYVDLDEIYKRADMAGKGVYKNLEELAESVSFQSKYKQQERLASEKEEYTETQNTTKGIEILEYWTDDWVVQVANESVVIQSNENPFEHKKKPFTKWLTDVVEDEFYGVSLVDKLRHLQIELNTTRNQRIDNVAMAINKMFKIRAGANIDPEQLISRPAGFVELEEMEDLQEMEQKPVNSEAYTEEEIIKRDMDDVIGIYDPQRGSSGQRRETATTMTILDRAGNQRFELMVLMLETVGLLDMYQQIIELDQQYINKKAEFFLQNSSGGVSVSSISPADMAGSWEIVSAGSAVDPFANSELKINNLKDLMVQAKGIPTINTSELFREILKQYKIPAVDRFFITPQQAGQNITPQPGALDEMSRQVALGNVEGLQ